MASPSSSSGEPPPPPPAALIVIPERLDFYVGDRTTHKRIFTVYNPYEIDVKYKGEQRRSKNQGRNECRRRRGQTWL